MSSTSGGSQHESDHISTQTTSATLSSGVGDLSYSIAEALAVFTFFNIFFNTF